MIHLLNVSSVLRTEHAKKPLSDFGRSERVAKKGTNVGDDET